MIKGILWEVRSLINGIFGWGIITPLSCLIPKKQGLIIVIGMREGFFADNAKYFFLYLHEIKQKNLKVLFLTKNKSVFERLKQENFNTIFYPTVNSIMKLLRASIVVADSPEWIKDLKYYFLFKSRKIQLWHSIGFKTIELNCPGWGKNRSLKRRIYDTITGRFPTYDLVISTSEFYTKNFFSISFRTKKIIESGYPRNDCFFEEMNDIAFLGTDRDNLIKVRKLKENNYKIVLYAPTWRESGRNPVNDNTLDIEHLSKLAVKHKIFLVFKPHPNTRHNSKSDVRENIINFDSTSDIYPLLPSVDLLVTDYSSIYMDFLLIDKPIVFFPYDYQEYVSKDRETQFDYDWITPGPKCFTQAELESEIIRHLIKDEDEYKGKRREILNVAFKYKDGKSSERIWNFIKKNYLILEKRKKKY